TRSGRSLLRSTGNIGKDKIMSGNGVGVDNEVFREEIEVGANIKPIEPELTVINPSVSVSVSAPIVNLDALPGTISPTMPTMPTVTAPVVAVPTAPSGVNVSVTTPGAVDRITVTAPTVTTPTTPSDKNINVTAPATPTGFEPTTVTAPTAPSIPVIVPPTIPSFASNVVSRGNGTANHIDTRTLSNGVIEMVAIKGGNFNLVRNTANTWTYEYTGYSGANVWAQGGNDAKSDLHADVGAGLTWSSLARTSTASSGSQLGFQKLVGSGTQSTMLSNATFLYTRGMENAASNLGEFVHLDIHGAAAPAGQRTGLDTGTNGLTNKTAILAAYDDAGNNINWTGRTSATSDRYTWINSGKLVVEGGNTSITNHYDHYGVIDSKAIVINTGDIIFQPYFNGTNYYQKYTSAFVMSLSGNTVQHIMYNGPTGSIKTYTQTASIFLSGSSGSGRPLSIVNRGTLEMYGENSAGIFLKTGSNNDLYFATDNFAFNSATNTVTAGSYKPLKLFGDKSIGLYGAATDGSTIGNFAVDIGETGKGNQNFTTSTASGTTNGTNLVDYNINPSGGTNKNIEGSFGIIANAPMNLTSHQIRIYDKTENNVGVYPNADVALNLGGGEISLNGGDTNIGILINGKGSVTSTGNISVTGGVKNMAVYVKGANSGPAEAVTVNKVTATNTEDSVVVYGESGAKITVNELNVVSKVGANPTTVNGKDTGAAFASGANTVITINRAATPGSANISITGSKLDDADRYVGFGVMATNGGVVNAKNNYIKVTNGSTAAASIGTNSNIDLSGGTVEFDGSGYAVYSDGVGKINLSNSKMILKGKATAFDVDMLAGTPPVTLDANSRIHVESNDVVVFNLKNAAGLSTSGLESSITTALGTALGGANLSDLIVAGLGIDKYKIAAVDGGTISIGDLDKTGIGAGGETQAQKDGNFYYNRFLGQRLVATATGSTISAVLDNTQASKFNNQVVGLEMNSSKLAVTNAEAGINLVNSTIIADRDGSGSGAIGAFINYGVVTLDGTSSIKVEKESNAANAQAVGIYGVNGSNISNAGNIEVGGEQSIGILGMAYREDSSSTPIVNEFGSLAVGQGKANITNSNKITLDGTGTIGIYAYNNNTIGTKADVVVTNTLTGEIKVGHSSGSNAAIGIYGEKATISNLGKVSVGDGGVAIYAKNGTEVINLGTLDLGADGVGVMLDGTSDITATSVIVTSNNTGTLGKTAIFYKGTGSETKNINIAVNASALAKGTAIYAEDMNIVSSGTLDIGTSGIGIYIKGSMTNTGTNQGTINLTSSETGAVGMYTKTSNILNNTTGIINVNDVTQVGMYAEGTNAKAINKGTINLNVDGTTGIYVKSGATTELDTGNTIIFNGKSSVGIFAENATVNIKDNLTLSNNNENKNIFVYGKAATVGIDSGKTVTVDGLGTPATPGNKTVGIYLENAGTGSTFNGALGQLIVQKEAVGIYSKGNNTLNVNVTATGEKTTGVFIDGGSTITGTVTARGASGVGAVGVYGSGGAVTIGAGGLTLNTDTDKGTGMYLTDGASTTGGTITVNNTVAGTKNIGVYYSKGTASGTVTNGADISLVGSDSIGIYAADGITLVNSANISSIAGQSHSIASYVGGGSQLTSSGAITLNDTTGGIGIYAEEGKGINSGTITLNSASGSMVGMVSEAKSGKTASVENTNTITAGNNLGMYIAGAGNSSGKNTGNIIASGTGTGVYVDGSGNSFNGTGGTITSNAVGIYLKDTDTNKITAGTLNIASGGVGVFGENAKIDFAVNVTGTGAVGVAAKGTSVISGNITTGQDSVGVYLLDDTVTFNGANITTGTNNSGTSVMNVNGGTGVYIHGGTANLGTSGNLTFNFLAGGGIGVFNNGGTLNLGNNITVTGSGSLAATSNGSLNSTGNLNIGEGATGMLGTYDAAVTGVQSITNNGGTITATSGTTSTINGTITVGESSATKSAIGVVANAGSNVTLTGTTTITTGKGGIGVYAQGAGTTITVPNTANITVGAEGIYMYSKDATLNFTGNITANNQIGIVADGGTINAMGASTITVQNGGIGAYVKGAAPAFGTTTIAVQAGTSAGYSMGVYYDGVAALGTAPAITQTGNYTIGMVLNNSTGTTAGGISIGGSGITNQVGVMAKGNSDLTVAGAVTVSDGNDNIGIYGENSVIKVNGNISVGSATSLATSSIGVFIDKGTYTGTTGNISVGKNSIGIFGKDLNGGSISQTGTTMTVGDSGVGIYGTGIGSGTKNINLTMTTGITLGNNNSIGVYAKNINSSVTGDMYVGTNTSIGIVSEGTGNVTYSGDLTIADKGTGEKDTGSVGIYKKEGAGTVNILAGNWTVGNNGYGIFLKQAGEKATINNAADMTLGTAAVGIFLSGENTINNTGDITVGKTFVPNGDHNKVQDHLNSVGMYITGRTIATNSGTITVNHDHSAGVYASGIGTSFTNTGTMNIDSGGVGIIVRDGAEAINAFGANINLGGTPPPAGCNAVTVGMSAGMGSKIINNGTITVDEGAGMLVVTGATFENNGTIVVNNGVGIEGIGSTANAGHIVVNGGSAVGSGGLSTANVGSVIITPDGTVTINGNYTSIGGTLSTAGNIIVNGAYVDATTGTPLFNANSVSGEVKIMSNFATTGNGRTYEMEGFVNTAMGTITGTKLTPVTSPLFIAKVTDKGSLVIAKRDYNDLVIGEQFAALYKGLDNILEDSNGEGRDAEILKGLNKYLNDFSGEEFERETSRTLAETRGDIYATIQGRMQDINRAFDNSFYELESSYNMTKDSSKYSVIYTDGNYKDSTLGIDDYDYKVMGLLYMKEKEGTEYGSKYGYTVGFAGSKFDFDDGGSKEDVYSLRVGAHRVKNLSEEHKVSWLSRIELGYNRHIAKRKLNLQETFENKGEYNTYSVALDNRLTKVIYTDLSRQLDVYADLDLEYGKIDDFKESAGSKGGLEVQIKDNDYLSAQAGAGVKASQRIYAGNDISVKVTADVKYAYEFGDNYDGNKANLKNGREGYYSLITPEEREGKLTGKIGLTVEKANHMGVTFEVEAADEGHKKDSSIKYGVRFNYKF
ncbi:autotransporter-associated N-terminal domain-containing protein, partial [Fusobacterium ulcerans]